jgi:hypothetical protein
MTNASSLDHHFGALRALLATPAPLRPALTHTRYKPLDLPWTLHPALNGFQRIFALAAQGRRQHRARWDEQVLPYLMDQLASWPDEARCLHPSLHRAVLAKPPGYASPVLQLVRSMSLVNHSVREANTALRDDRLAHLTHLALPPCRGAEPLPHLPRWRLPALRSLELRYPHISIVELVSTLQQTSLPALEHLTLGGVARERSGDISPAVWHAFGQLPLLARLRGLCIAPIRASFQTDSEIASRWIELVGHMPALTHLDLRWATLSQPAMERLCEAPCFASLDALDLVSQSPAAAHVLPQAPRLPSPRALALRHISLPQLIDTPLFARVEELELWLRTPANDLAMLSSHPRWQLLTSLSLDLRGFKPDMLRAIDPPPRLRALRLAWKNNQRALSPADLAAVAAWSGLCPLPTIKTARAALLTDLEPLP